MRTRLLGIIGLVLLLGVAACAGWLLWQVIVWFLGLPSGSQTTVGALVGVVSVPIITYFTSRSLERRRARENAIREHKTKLYDELITGFMKMLDIGKTGKMTSAELGQFFASVAPRLLTYGSRKVIVAWNQFRRTAAGAGTGDSIATVLAFEGLLKAMRADLGHSTLTTAQGDLVGTFITDIHATLEARKRDRRASKG